MYGLVRGELARVRRMIELTDDPFLLYLIDVAIIETDALSANESLETLDLISPKRSDASLEPADGNFAC